MEVSKIIRNSIEYKKCIFNGNEWEVLNGPPANEIWYTSSDGNIVTPYQTSSLPEIDTNTYSNSKGVIKFATNITSIGHEAFSDCTNLASVTIPNSVTSIGERTFYNCTGLTSVIIDNGVTSIGDNAFANCTNLQIIIYNNILSNWNNISLSENWNLNTTSLNMIRCTDQDKLLKTLKTAAANIYASSGDYYAKTHGWSSGLKYETVDLTHYESDGYHAIETKVGEAVLVGTENNGKYYSGWRFYTSGSENGSFVINSSKYIYDVTLRFTPQNSGKLYIYNTENKILSSNTFKVDNTTITLLARNDNELTNGGINLTSIYISYFD